MAAKVSKMDPDYDQYFRVIGAADDAEAIAAAAAAWPETYGKDWMLWEENDPRWETPEAPCLVPELKVESSGWYRCQPCVCGDEHRYDVFPTEPHARGASFTRFVGLAPMKVTA